MVDGVLEDVRLGLELNISKMNQRRFSGLKVLGELYSYQLVESNVVFRTLYLMLQFGATIDGGFTDIYVCTCIHVHVQARIIYTCILCSIEF